jgi:hypothetical protein
LNVAVRSLDLSMLWLRSSLPPLSPLPGFFFTLIDFDLRGLTSSSFLLGPSSFQLVSAFAFASFIARFLSFLPPPFPRTRSASRSGARALGASGSQVRSTPHVASPRSACQ